MKVSYYPAKFGSQRDYSSGDIMVSVCPVAIQDHVVKALNYSMVRSPSRHVTILPSLVTIRAILVEIY